MGDDSIDLSKPKLVEPARELILQQEQLPRFPASPLTGCLPRFPASPLPRCQSP
jgi:hypothetical protein